jgi:hypothetical protein
VYQATAGDAGVEVSKVELESGKKHRVRLGALAD